MAIPYNISAYDTESLAVGGVTSISDLSRVVPGLASVIQGPVSRGGNNNFILRGLNGSRVDNNTSLPFLTVSTVSTYVGETPVFFPIRITDIERVEVLRGPQGTLYGSGATGGTIRIIPKRPDPQSFSGEFVARVGYTDESSEESYSIQAIANLPIGAKTAVRFAGGYESVAGFIDARGLVQTDENGIPIAADPDDPFSPLAPAQPTLEDVNDSESTFLRGSLLFEFSEDVELLLTYHWQEGEQSDQQVHNPFFQGDGIVPALGKYDQGQRYREPYENETELVSAELSVDFGFATLTSSTSFYDIEEEFRRDGSGLFEAILAPFYGFFPRLTAFDDNTTLDRAFVEEVRLASNAEDARLDWIIGAYYQDKTNRLDLLQDVPGIMEFAEEGLGFTVASDQVFTIDREFTFEDVAVFGELTWHITEDWQVTGGVRAFWQDFTNDFVQTAPFCGSFCAEDGVDPLGTTARVEERSFEDQIFKLNTSYDLDDRLMAYFTWSQGFRRGGSSVLPLSGIFAEPEAFQTFEPDKATNWEIGLKGTLLEDRVQFSVASFYIDWDKLQFDSRGPTSAFQFVANGNNARTTGVELEGTARVSDRLTVTGGYSFIDAELTEDFDIGGLGTIVGKDGDRLPGVPEHSATLVVDYVQPLSSDLDLRLGLQGLYRSGTVSTFPLEAGGQRYFDMDGFQLWNASIGVESNRWNVSLLANNLFSDEAVTAGTPPAAYTDRGQIYFIARPFTLALQFGYHFD
jgi:outer membrane receptor protein involved in Fe transport